MTIKSKVIRVLSTLLLIAICSQLIANDIAVSFNPNHRHAHITKSIKVQKTCFFNGAEEDSDELEKSIAEHLLVLETVNKQFVSSSTAAYKQPCAKSYKLQLRPIWLIDESIIR